MATTTSIQTNKMNSVRDLFQQCQKQIAAALPRHMTPEKMARMAFSAAQRQPLLFECTAQSLALSIINASELGLEPNLIGEAYLIPYGKTCTLIPGYKGLMKLARNSGMVKSFQVGVVREGDTFEYERGSNKFLKHREKEDNEGAKITHYWAGALVDGVFEFDVMTAAQVDKIRQSSKASGSGPWKTHPEEMGKKTVIRRFCKLLPASSELAASMKLAKAVALDERADAGLPPISDIVDLGAAEEVEPNTTGAGAKVAAKLEAKGKPQAPAIPSMEYPEFDAWASTLTQEQKDQYDDAFTVALDQGMERADAHENAYLAVVGSK